MGGGSSIAGSGKTFCALACFALCCAARADGEEEAGPQPGAGVLAAGVRCADLACAAPLQGRPGWPTAGGLGFTSRSASRPSAEAGRSDRGEPAVAPAAVETRRGWGTGSGSGWGELSYSPRGERHSRPLLPSGGLKYALPLDDCMHMVGLYGRSAGFGVGLAGESWSVALAGGAGERGMALRLGYAIPLDAGGNQPRTCGAAQ